LGLRREGETDVPAGDFTAGRDRAGWYAVSVPLGRSMDFRELTGEASRARLRFRKELDSVFGIEMVAGLLRSIGWSVQPASVHRSYVT
jgi:hypothetical protein